MVDDEKMKISPGLIEDILNGAFQQMLSILRRQDYCGFCGNHETSRKEDGRPSGCGCRNLRRFDGTDICGEPLGEDEPVLLGDNDGMDPRVVRIDRAKLDPLTRRSTR